MERKLRVMLVDPPVPNASNWYPYPSSGVLYLAGSIRDAFPASDIQVKYQNAFCSLPQHVRAVESYRPDLYGISFSTSLALHACEAMRAVRAAFPRLPIIAGGAHPSSMPEDVLDNSPADATFQGECEGTILELLQRWPTAPQAFEALPGVVFRDGGRYVRSARTPAISDLDGLPWPAWDLINPTDYPGFIYQRGYPATGVVTTRGCPWQCGFCSKPLSGIPGSRAVRWRPPEQVVEEVEYLYQRGLREIRLYADELNCNVSRARELLHRLAALGHHDLYFNCQLRADAAVITPDLADAMRDARVWLAYVGVESASQRTLDGVTKNLRLEEVEASFALLKRRGIKIFGNFILYPVWESSGRIEYENTRDAYRTIAYAAHLRIRRLMDYMSVSVITPRPGSVTWNLATKHHLFRVPTQEPFYYLHRGMKLPGIDDGQVRRVLTVGRGVQAAMAITGGALSAGFIRRLIRKRRVLMGSYHGTRK
jgi:anaerobic magnesium-protoporphyrin IX monomethyl ester cyclase